MIFKELGHKILEIWIFIGEIIRRCLAAIILTTVYFLLITPFGIVLRLFNRLQYNNQNDLDTKSKKVDINYPF